MPWSWLGSTGPGAVWAVSVGRPDSFADIYHVIGSGLAAMNWSTGKSRLWFLVVLPTFHVQHVNYWVNQIPGASFSSVTTIQPIFSRGAFCLLLVWTLNLSRITLIRYQPKQKANGSFKATWWLFFFPSFLLILQLKAAFLMNLRNLSSAVQKIKIQPHMLVSFLPHLISRN